MNYICVRFKQVGLLYGEKFGFYECCAHGKQHGCVTFGDYVLLCPSKQIVGEWDLSIQLKVC